MKILNSTQHIEIEVGQSIFQEKILSIWEFAKDDEFTFYENGFQKVLVELTKENEKIYKARIIKKSEVTEEIKEELRKRNNIF